MDKCVVRSVDGGIHVARDCPGLIDPFLIGYVEPQRFRPESRPLGPSASDQSQELLAVSAGKSCANRNGIRRQGNSPRVKRRIGNRGVGSRIPGAGCHLPMRQSGGIDPFILASDPDHRDRRPLLGLRQTSSAGEVQVEVPGGFAADVSDVEFEYPFHSLDSTSLQ